MPRRRRKEGGGAGNQPHGERGSLPACARARLGFDASSAFFQATPGPRPEQWFKIAAAEANPPTACLAVNAAATKSSPSSARRSETVPYQSPEPSSSHKSTLPRRIRGSPGRAGCARSSDAAAQLFSTPEERHLRVAAGAARRRRPVLPRRFCAGSARKEPRNLRTAVPARLGLSNCRVHSEKLSSSNW